MAAGPQLSLQTLISAGMLVIGLFGAGWALMQSQFSYVERTIETDRKTANDSDKLLHTDLTALGEELKARVADIHNELRHDVVIQNEFLQFLSRYEMTLRRIESIEQTIRVLAERTAKEPVEKSTIDAINMSVMNQIGIMQTQISDINRQIAAALIMIDSNSKTGAPQPRPLLPPK